MKIIVFTSITVNYLPKAQVLARSVKRFHPEAHFCLVVAEPTDPDLTEYEPAFDEVLTLNALPLPNREAWIFKHSVVEICTAIKGFALSHLLDREGVEAVIYLDPDIAVFGRFDPLLDLLQGHDVVLTPHLCEPEEEYQAILDNELSALKHGVYNLGFLAVSRRPEGRRFAAWWQNRLEHFCYADINRGIFTDQRWVDLAPAFFPTLGLWRHPGCNVATWNLNRRRLEGDFDRGFVVNNLPLLFYHFSGFDSGAQLIMLQRYAADMPAAFLLREWYIEETARLDVRRYERRRWLFDRYDNGEPILPEQRVLYREQDDLPHRFPHPFVAAGDSYLAWCRNGPGAAPPPGTLPPPAGGLTPLERYLTEPALFRSAPHPWFDGEFYLRHYPDIAAAGINPLLHYAKSGHDENRKPHPRFETAFVRATRDPALVRAEDPLLDFVLNGCSGRTDSSYHPIEDAEVVQQLRQALDPGLPTVLMIAHCGTGGTGVHIERLARYLAGRANTLLLSTLPPDRVRLTVPGNAELNGLFWDLATSLESLCGVLRVLRVERLHVHHLLYNEKWLPGFIEELGLPYDLTLHDYYLLAPEPFLCNSDGVFVGDQVLDSEDHLLAAVAETAMCDVEVWRQPARSLLRGAARVLAPSHDLAARYRRLHPDLVIRVVPHPEEPRPEKAAVHLQPCPSSGRLRVALMGNIQPHKGKHLVEQCAKLAMSSRAPVDFHVIGPMSTALSTDMIDVLGQYRVEDLPDLIRRVNPHLAWFPAMCPESYSFTLSEAMLAGLPVLASDLGALPERLRGRPWSWLFPWDAGPDAWLERLLEIRERHFVRGEPATAEGEAPEIDEEYYRNEYLDWARRTPRKNLQASAGPFFGTTP